ncbi:LacI family DNA-binding transcriptional regulator [Ideonella sp. A 288]|uniref:LacI family DNA-binding transcriptional regulator n=1 Tax=Ideonella sp. A 288 TaxID=1962181 RepID=UPI000B4ACE99|nr:LacI family DNA-binding transcriptional regulator [Ideonella sp. A 288]
MDRSTAPTVEDVARAAGVSTATVSRALNRPDAVRPALRDRVLAAVAQLGYVAHAGARAMSLRRSGTVGVVVPTIDNAIFARGLQAFQQRMAQAGHLVLLAFSDYDAAQEEAQAQALLARGVDALALTGISQRPALTARLAQRGLPWVHTGSFPAPAGTACVGFRNREAIERAVRYLLDLGHRRIAMLAGITADNDRAAERVAGVRHALAAAGLRLSPKALVEAAYTLQAAREGTRTLLSADPAPTALLCGNDVLAWGALLECQARGVAVPQALSIVGFDDLELSRHWQPALTTVRVPTERMWTLAADYLLARLDGRLAEPQQQEIEVELLVRGSTAPPPRTARRRG